MNFPVDYKSQDNCNIFTISVNLIEDIADFISVFIQPDDIIGSDVQQNDVRGRALQPGIDVGGNLIIPPAGMPLMIEIEVLGNSSLLFPTKSIL